MPNYRYRVVFKDGKVGRGRIMALNKTHAIESLKKESTQPLMVKRVKTHQKKYKRLDYNRIEKSQKKGRFSNSSKKDNKNKIKFKDMTLKDLKNMNFHPFKRVTTKDLIVFSNNLYILKKAKFNNVQALQSLYDGMDNPVFRDVIEDLLIGVESGERLHTVMEAYPKTFPAMFVNFIRVGEEAGTLDTALLYARDYIESSTKLRKQIRSAIIPRVLQFFLIMGMMFVALLIGVPILEDVYSMFDSQESIPAATMAGLRFAQWVVANWYVIVAAIALIVSLFVVYINTPKGRFKWDKFLLTFPVIGPLITNITISKFFQAMLLNLRNGMRIQESLEISKNVTSNYYFLSAVEAGKANSLAGSSWLTPFEEQKLFKPMVSEMVSIGMKTDLAEMMSKVNEYVDMEIQESLNKFVKVLPDITYAFVGVALIAFVITVMVPLTNVYMGGFIDMPT
ncbi:MAG: type II secretion system F family protein [Clostridia bacterium]